MKQYRKTVLVKFGKELKEKNLGPIGPNIVGNYSDLNGSDQNLEIQ